MIWILSFFTLFFALSAVMNMLEDRLRGFVIHGAIAFVLFIVTIVYFFYHPHP